MFGSLIVACASGNSRQICRKITTTMTAVTNLACRWNFASVAMCTVSDTTCISRTRRQDFTHALSFYGCCPSLHQSNVSRHFASKAASKFGRKIKKETFDRFLGMDPSRLQYGYGEISELEDADESVRRIFSLEFAHGREIRELQQIDTLEDIGVDMSDNSYTNLLAIYIARLTVSIRNLAPQIERFPRDKKNKRVLLMMIDHRRKYIKLLRRTNFDLANRLLEKLNLEFTPSQRYTRRMTKRSVEKNTLCKEAFEQRMKALEEFTGRLKEEQLREIAELKKDLGMELTDEERGRLQQDSI